MAAQLQQALASGGISLDQLSPEQQMQVLQALMAGGAQGQKEEPKVQLRAVMSDAVNQFKSYAMNVAFWGAIPIALSFGVYTNNLEFKDLLSAARIPLLD